MSLDSLKGPREHTLHSERFGCLLQLHIPGLWHFLAIIDMRNISMYRLLLCRIRYPVGNFAILK